MRKKAFTLLEIVIAVAILSVSVVTIVSQSVVATRMTGKAKSLITAAQLSRNLLNEIQLEGKIEAGGDDGSFEDFKNYTYEYKIEKVDLKEIMPQDEDETTMADISVEHLFKIHLSVYWSVAGREQQYETFSFLFSEKK